MCANVRPADHERPGERTSAASWMLLAVLVSCFGAAAILAGSPETWGGFVASNMLAAAVVVVLWRRADVGLLHVVVLALLVRLFYFWLPPVLSDDVYRYIWDGLVQLHGINPFAYTPNDPRLAALHEEPIYEALNSAAYHTVYPPLSQVVFRVGAWFYEVDWRASYFAIKGLLAACEAAAMLLLARRLDARRLMLYAWNPLVVLTAAGQAHTESLAVLCLVAAWLLARRDRGGWASVALAGAGLVKLYPFLLFPLLWRRFGWKSVWPGALAAAALMLPFAHPDLIRNVLSSLDLYVRSFEFNAGLYYGVKKVFEIMTGTDWSKQIGPAFRWLFLLSLPVVYFVDARLDWSFRRAAVVILGLFFIFSTTVHPWYLLPLIALVATVRPPSWHWYWLGVASIGTYLLYVGGPYWSWVIVGWGGWAVLLLLGRGGPPLDALMRRRARAKSELIREFLPDVDRPAILDLGAGEGYVGSDLDERTNADVTLADIRDMNRTGLKHVVFDGKRLPFADGQYDAVLLIFVLHHAADPVALTAEAGRVCRGNVIVLESVYRTALQRKLLAVMDRLANHVRSRGMMDARREVLRFDTFQGWMRQFSAQGFRVAVARDLGGLVHRRALYVLEPRRPTDGEPRESIQ